MLEFLLALSVSMIAFAYFGYPATLIVMGWFRGKEVKKDAIHPRVTFIITVLNEEKRVREKIENTIALQYPKERMEILVASDGSTDRTNEIVREYFDKGVRLLELPERRGKENAQKEALKLATGEVIVFSDAATIMEPGGLDALVSNFADSSVGCVSSEDKLMSRNGTPSGEGMYVRYEMWLRSLESRSNSLVGLSGSLFAARKLVCADFAGDMQSDFRILLNSVQLGLRGVNDPSALGIYYDIANQNREWERKVRTVLRGLTVFFCHINLLNFLKYGLFSYQLFCHKLLRWLVPFFMLLAFGCNVALARTSPLYGILLSAQLCLYGLAAIGLLFPKAQGVLAVKLPTYFLAVNASIGIAWWRYLGGKRVVAWTPTER